MRGKESQEEWNAEKRMYEGIYASRTGRSTHILDIEEDELGYTGKDGNIHLKKEHPLMAEMSRSEKISFRAGVFCHEMLHQIYTDFDHLDTVLDREVSRKKQEIIQLFANLIEDPAIEHQAPEVVGGSLLKSLNYTIRTIYESARPINESGSAFSELCNALIQFGDMGLIKGEFSEEALSYFKTLAPEFNAEILDPSSSRRIDAAVRWAEVTRPLWESKSQEEIEQEAEDIMQNASSTMSGSGSGSGQKEQENNSEENGPDGEDESQKDGKAANREEILRKLEAGERISVSKEEADAAAESVILITAADFQQMEQEVWDSMDPYEKEIVSNVQIDEIPDIQMPEYHGTECRNIPADAVGLREEYAALVAESQKEIRILTRSLRNIFINDVDEEMRATSGKYNILRGVKGNTVKVFDKKKERKNIDDLAVMILVDESGSMGGSRIENAKTATTILAEAFSNLKIPCSIIGFTADEEAGADITHRHYVSWRNTAIERTSIASMDARCNNFDGYSIRYAGRLTQRRNAEHKIMFVISDGMPNCFNYTSMTDGIKDTADAIREIGRTVTVMGIGIGGKNENYSRMYGGNFVNTEPETLAVELAKQLKRIIRKY